MDKFSLVDPRRSSIFVSVVLLIAGGGALAAWRRSVSRPPPPSSELLLARDAEPLFNKPPGPPRAPTPTPPAESDLPASSVSRYDFDDQTIEPSAYGPRVRDQSRDPVFPASRLSPVGVAPMLNGAFIRGRVGNNAGAFTGCVAEAAARRPGLAGRIVLQAFFDGSGSASASLSSSTVADAPLETCLTTALGEVWLPATGRGIRVTIPFRVDTTKGMNEAVLDAALKDTAPHIEAAGAAALLVNDGARALRRYSALLRQRPGDPRSCDWYAGALEATVRVAPWIDERSLEAIEALGRSLGSGVAGARVPPCLLRGGEIGSEVVRLSFADARMLRRASDYRATVERSRRILAALPQMPNSEPLRFFAAEALFELGNLEGNTSLYCEAAALYRSVAQSASPLAKSAMEAAPIATRLCQRDGQTK